MEAGIWPVFLPMPQAHLLKIKNYDTVLLPGLIAAIVLEIKTDKLIKNLLLGIDYNNYGWSKNDYRNSPSTRISILNHNYANNVPAANPANDYYDDNKQYIHLLGGYIQDQVNIGSKLRILLSLRHDFYKLVQTPLSSKDDLQGDASDAKARVPRAGIVYLLFTELNQERLWP